MERSSSVGFAVRDTGGVPALYRGDTPFPAAGYMTYLWEYGHWADFARAGTRLYSFPVLFAGKWISASKGLRPFSRGIFDGETPDYTVFDGAVEELLRLCPGAYLLPRVNVSMPDRWLKAHPEALDGTGERESLLHPAFWQAAEAMLRAFVAHAEQSAYRSRIAGYHLAGGNTEEWFPFDMHAGLSPAAAEGFAAFLRERYPGTPFAGLPDLAALASPGLCHGDAYLEKYLEFSVAAPARGITRLARAVKETAGRSVPVGVFYGYALEVTVPLSGTHALKTLLESPDVDFLCSPNSYVGVRSPDADWTEMYAADSVRLHGKLCLQENDVRTHLTRPLGVRAPEYDPDGRLNAPIWQGLKDADTAVAQMRKSFCRQLIKGNGFWWFDMWGGWYDDPRLMAEIKKYNMIYTDSLTLPDRGSIAEAAVFIDETVYRRMSDCGQRGVAYGQRVALGHAGAPYDLYDVFDFESVCKKYKAVLFMTGMRTPAVAAAEEFCRQNGVPCLCCADKTPLYTAEELADFYARAGVHLYCAPGDVLYVNRHFAALYAVTGGTKTLRFPQKVTLTDLLDGAPPRTGQTVTFPAEKGKTCLFGIG